MSDAAATTEEGSDSILEVENLNTFYGKSHALFDVSLSIERGESVALVGRNGAGKTTTLRSIMGIQPPKSGAVRLHGEDIAGRSPDEVRRRGISWVPEGRRIFPDLTVRENLRVAAGSGDEEFEEVYRRFPRLDERRNQLGGTLSGGEQQMLAIARALLGPEMSLLMLDEPTEGLAPQIVDDVVDIVDRLNAEGVTMLIVEQNAQVALELADRVYVIETGHIEYEGTSAELRENRELMESYLGVQ
ncbi:ABC transporter ATP-binding protein [Halorarius halobius]|uniref:ABC transporter ATP-binding protein n=1 Tax=Halorarius halobius TaxID=2962671 RepID=UPI0020CBB00D|nr:ABC transporter ATP-binding protein [Halorarius halobius]